jgi:hypothetical protein
MTFCKDCRPEKKQANYGRQGGKPTHCSKHGKSHGFVDLVNKRCDHDDIFAFYGVKGGKRTHVLRRRASEDRDAYSSRGILIV